MNCTYFRELGSAIVDNEATDAEIKEFNEHILTCEECAQWFETIKILKDETGTLQEEVPAELKDRVMYSVANANKKPSFFSRFRFTAVAAVFAVIILAANGLGIFNSPEQQSPAKKDANPASPPSASLSAAPSQARIAPAPETATTESEEVLPPIPYDRDFSYVLYIKDDAVTEVLIDVGFEVKDGYRCYITNMPLDTFADFPQELIYFNAGLDTEGLVMIKEPIHK